MTTMPPEKSVHKECMAKFNAATEIRMPKLGRGVNEAKDHGTLESAALFQEVRNALDDALEDDALEGHRTEPETCPKCKETIKRWHHADQDFYGCCQDF